MAIDAKGLALNLSLSVLILTMPYLVALLIDIIFNIAGYQTALVTVVSPLYVLAIRLLGVALSFLFLGIDLIINFLLSLLNMIPGVNITYTSHLSDWIRQFSEDFSSTILQFTAALSAGSTLALKKK